MAETEITIPGNQLAWDVYEHGFTVVADENVAGSYEFDRVLVVKAPDGTIWGAHDSGCSCPSPFEDHTWPTDWNPIRQLSDLEPLFAEFTRDDGTAAARIRYKVKEVLR